MIELPSTPPGKIRPGRAIIRHEQRVANKNMGADLVDDTGRRMPGRMDDFNVERTKLDMFAIFEQQIKFAAVAGDIMRIENWTEDFLHLADMLANPDFCPCFQLDVRRARKMIRMGMGLQNQCDRQTIGFGFRQNSIRRCRGRFA